MAGNRAEARFSSMGRLRKLAGYRRGQLVTCWGEPDAAVSETQDIWDCGEEFSLLVTYREDGKVKEAALARRFP